MAGVPTTAACWSAALQLAAEVGHAGDVGDAALPDPSVDLPRVKAGIAVRFHQRLELGEVQPGQIHRWSTHGHPMYQPAGNLAYWRYLQPGCCWTSPTRPFRKLSRHLRRDMIAFPFVLQSLSSSST